VIDKLLQHFIPNLNDHLSDDRLASLFCNELPLTGRLTARRHLAKCWHCRVRQGDLEGPRAERVIPLYRELLHGEDWMPSARTRAEFVQRLEQHIQQLPPPRWRMVRALRTSLSRLPSTNTSFAMAGACFLTALFTFLFWWQQRVPDISSNTLLVCAERWDSSNPAKTKGIVYESVRITAPKITMERSIYRDLEGKRSQKPMKLAAAQENLRAELALAGIHWDEPMSAWDYQTWHDHQRVRTDKIVRVGKHLLKLTTTAPNCRASQESITVRDTDFHPVKRTVALRDLGTVEIAELDYKILPWSAVGTDVFQPIDSPPSTPPVRKVLSALPKLPQVVTQGQLDEAELAARLILNQLHADSGEQIEVRREQESVAVEGVVETDERKRELQAQLRTVPHLVVSIQSLADLKNSAENTPREGLATNVQSASMPDQPSPLAIFLRAHGHSVTEINRLAQRFFNTALTVSQESKAIVDLQTRFVPSEQRTLLAAATLSELIYSHRERLESALRDERALLKEAQGSTAQPIRDRQRPSSLMDAAGKNLALSRELTQTNGLETRSVEEILKEMWISVDELTADVYEKTPGDSTLSEKK
jgi:hypothetical protein